MVTQITLGSFFSANGRSVLGGVGGSGLNTQVLIESLLQAKAAPAQILQQQITKENSKVAALQEFYQLVSSFQSIANSLRNPPGVANAAENAFRYNSVSLTSDLSISAGTYLSVTASPGVPLQSYTVTDIDSLAAATKQLTDTFVVADADTAGIVVASAPAAGQFLAGTVTVNGTDITLETTDTVNSIAQKFNAVSVETGILASVVKVSDGNFKLSFTGIENGTAYDFDLSDAGTVTDPDGVFDQITFTTTQTAADAIFTIDGVQITRSTNTISDVIDGLTFNLLALTPDAPDDPTITVSITADSSTAFNSIVALADAYNNLKVFEAEQLETNSDGTYADTAILASNQTFRITMDLIAAELTALVSGLADGDPDSLGDIGISFTDSPATADTPEIRNVLTIDENELRSFLNSDFNAVRDLFQFRLTSDNVNLQIFKRTNALGVSAFTLDLNPFASQVTDTLVVADADTQIAFTTPSDGQLGEGDITINGETISIVDGDTLNTIKAKFDAVEANTGVTVTITEVSTGEFTLTFDSAPQSGQLNLFDLTDEDVDASGVFSLVEITATGTFQATYDLGAGDVTVDLDGTAVTGGGFLLAGQSGTALEGLQLIYGTSVATYSDISVTVVQGIGDRLYNSAFSATDPVDGSIVNDLGGIQEKTDDLEEEIDKINEQVEQFREILLLKFSALEQAIAKVNNLLATLDANDQARRQFSS